MTADQCDFVLRQHRKTAAHDLGQDREVDPFFRKACNCHRRNRGAAHGPHVVDRIKRRNAAVIERIIYNRREEIERLHERQIVTQTIHSGVVRFVETDQQIRIERLSLKPAQHLSEDARRELGRSTRARNHLSQTHRVPPLEDRISERFSVAPPSEQCQLL